MIEVSPAFENLAKSKARSPEFYAGVDWELDGEYADETEYLQRIEVERHLVEPLGGVSTGQADIYLINHEGRFTPDG